MKSEILADLAKSSQYSGNFTTAQLAARNVEYEFQNNVILNPDIPGDTENHELDEEFTFPAKVPLGFQQVNIIAVSKFKGFKFIDLVKDKWYNDYINQQEHVLSGVTYWFHATSHASARMIAENGIDVNRCRAGLDFSDGPGFYLTRLVS